MRTSFHHQSEAQPPNGPLTAATSPDTPSHMPSQAVRSPPARVQDSQLDPRIDRSAESAHCSLRPAASYDGSASNGQLKPRLSRGFFAGAPKRAPRRCASDFTTRPLQGPRPRSRVEVRRRPHGKVTGFTTSGHPKPPRNPARASCRQDANAALPPSRPSVSVPCVGCDGEV